VVIGATVRFGHQTLAGAYAAEEQRAPRTATLHAAARALLAAAAPGSDRQLVAFRAAISTSSDVEELAQWWAGRGLPDGLELDTELTWAMVERLTSLGGRPDAIDAVLAADRSASGEVHAARARAGRPTVEAKSDAWRLLTAPTQAGAYELYATAEGFFLPEQAALVRPYVARYFTDIPATAGFRTGWALGRVTLLAYPVAVAGEADLIQAEQTLRRSDLPAPIRRALADGTDELRRALRARKRYG
jgi:aminopeptidase N